MPLTDKQKEWIDQNRDNIETDKTAERFKTTEDEIKNYLNETMKRKTPWYFYLILIFIPVIFVLLLEGGLRLFNYGDDLSIWMDFGKDKKMLNHDVARRYFYTTNTIPHSNQDAFNKEKTDKDYRIFILGGSSGAGYPYNPIGGFSEYLQQLLENVYPESNIEVVNLSLTAVNSYTLRDFSKAVLDEEPDLVLIYAGHNEYYGALGAGSMENLGNSRFFVNLNLALSDYKTYQLIRDIIKETIAAFSSDRTESTGTLMSQMAKEQSITLDSDIFKQGISQFEGNMNDIISMFKDDNVPIIIADLVSNYKDQKPFISVKTDKYPDALSVYNYGYREYLMKNYTKSDSLLRFAKDLDALRFRAPKDINKVIYNLAEEYGLPVAKVDEAFSKDSPNGIVGENLMTDHLHPNLEGYFIIGYEFYKEMVKNGYLPKTKPINKNWESHNEITRSLFIISDLDIAIARNRIKQLENDWPYISPDKKKALSEIIPVKTPEDSIAYGLLLDKFDFYNAHKNMADYYLKKGNFTKFAMQLNVMIKQYPLLMNNYNYASSTLIMNNRFELAVDFLKRKYKLEPDDFTTKWLGIISLSKNKVEDAAKYLFESNRLNPDDPQVLYNLSGAYAKLGKFNEALSAINKCLELDPDFPNAVAFKSQIEELMK